MPSNDIREYGRHYKSLFLKFIALMVSQEVEDDILADEERSIIDDFGSQWIFHHGSNSEFFKSKVEKIFALMLKRAAHIFSPGSNIPIEIDHKQWKEQFLNPHYRNEDWTNFDPEILWNALVDAYHGDAGLEIGYQQSADALVKFFDIRPENPVTIKAGNVVLESSAQLDWMTKKWDRISRFGWETVRDTIKGLEHLKAFAVWADEADFADGIKEFSVWLDRNERLPVTSRQKHPMGPTASVSLFHFKLEYRLKPELAQQLQLFLSTFSTVLRDREAA